MGFGTDLDLTEIAPHYRRFYGSTFRKSQVESGRPFKVGSGPKSCSTSMALVPVSRPAFAWDVNGWYRYLGIAFPYVNATKGALAKAYVARGGSSDDRATYYLNRLLDRAVRAEYDAMPCGEQFLDDAYVQAALKQRAVDEASRRSADGRYTQPESVLDEWGYLNLLDDLVDTLGSDVDRGHVEDEDQVFSAAGWTYAYWLWKTRGSGGSAHLALWQSLLVRAMSDHGVTMDLSVGLMNDQPQESVVGKFPDRLVFFLHEDVEPDLDTARQAVEEALLLLRKTIT